MKRAIIVLVAAIFLVWGPAAALVKAQEKKAVRVAGAGLLSEWLQENSELYMKGAPACSVTISGATTGIGVQRLMEGNAELGALTIGSRGFQGTLISDFHRSTSLLECQI